MYRWFLFLVLLNVAEFSTPVRVLCRGNVAKYCRPSSPHNYKPPHNNYHGYDTDIPVPIERPTEKPVISANTFEDLAQNLIAAEAAIQKLCRDNFVGNIKEVYGADSYLLKYKLRGVKEKDITVRIKHRVIYVTVERLTVMVFKDMRILPNIVNAPEALWVMENNYLKIVVPYSVPFTEELVIGCGNVNDTVITVPKMSPGNIALRNLATKIGSVVTPTTTTPGTPSHNDYYSQPSATDGSDIDEVVNAIFGSTGEMSFDIRSGSNL